MYKWSECSDIRKKNLRQAMRERKEIKPRNLALLEIIEEDISTVNYKIKFIDKHNPDEIFEFEINIWDVILNDE